MMPGANLAVVDFLRQRLADAIERGDDQTASRLRVQLDRLLNGPQRKGGTGWRAVVDVTSPRLLDAMRDAVVTAWRGERAAS
jgi:hypothetical protein